MDGKIVGLDGKVVAPEPEYNTDVISLLETALADAKKYKAFGVSVALVMPATSETVGTQEGFDVDVYWHGKRLSLLAATSRLSHRLNMKCDEAMEIISGD